VAFSRLGTVADHHLEVRRTGVLGHVAGHVEVDAIEHGNPFEPAHCFGVRAGDDSHAVSRAFGAVRTVLTIDAAFRSGVVGARRTTATGTVESQRIRYGGMGSTHARSNRAVGRVAKRRGPSRHGVVGD